ncbi:hypothetical protein BH20ACI3_BH20ACI3_29010 [soil metagenome]
MKALRIVLLLAGATGLFTVVVFGIRALSSPARQLENALPHQSTAEIWKATPADLRIRAGEGQIKLRPEKPDGHNLLASAYMQKARETGDFGFNAKAEEALNRSLRVAPDNYDALKLRAKLWLTFHRFRDALAEAQRAQGLRPEDHDVYGALTDAYVELGEYRRGVEAAQRMVDLRPDAASYSRVAYLRSLHGDTEGAIEAMQVAVKAADPRDPEGVAWYRVHLGDELVRAGKLADSEREYDKALVVFPGHRMALAAKARARAAAGDYNAAIEIYKHDSSHDALLALGDLYTKLGRTDEAEEMYKAFEAAEREVAVEENDMSHLARFWADRNQNLDEALAVMQSERTKRADIHTCDALAWTLFKKGRLSEAKAAVDEALRLGTRDAKFSYHAGMIYNALGERRKAANYLKLALEINPSFDVLQSDAARQALDALRKV